jgi:cyclic beta-1,2-glucan synthetase
LIAQAWAVLSGVATPERQRHVMDAVEAHLVHPAAGLIQLLTPPLRHAEPSAGYIQAYPPGVRENGGQYAHGGVWALMAAAELAVQQPEHPGAFDVPYRYFTYLSPVHRAQHPVWGPVYAVEPYVMAADIYSQPPYVGRGGWSWYTGAAGWLHRAAVESMVGLHIRAHDLFFSPCLPTHWPGAEISLVRAGVTLRFVLVRATVAQVVGHHLPDNVPADARWLAVGQRLRWVDERSDACFVVPL